MAKPPLRPPISADPMIPDGVKRAVRKATDYGIGVEFSLWCGLGIMRDLHYVELRVGIATLYLTSRRIHRLVALLGEIRAKAKSKDEGK